MTATDTAMIPDVAPCPTWCLDQPHGWTDVRDHRDIGKGVEGERWCRKLLGTVAGYEVEASQYNSFNTGYGDYEIERQVYFFGERMTASDARQLAALLVKAAEMTEPMVRAGR
jgi:hypothetical protein